MFHEGKDLKELFGKLGAPGGFPTDFKGFAGSGRSLEGKSSTPPASPSGSGGSSISADEKAFNKKFKGSKGLLGGILGLIGFKRLRGGIGAAKLRQVSR